MKNRSVLGMLLIVFLSGCESENSLKPGAWRAALVPDAGRPALEIPFNLEIIRTKGDSVKAKITNAGEEILVLC